jgi:hypothetical protein
LPAAAEIVTEPVLAVTDDELATVTEPAAKIVTEVPALTALPNSTVTDAVPVVPAGGTQPAAGEAQPAAMSTTPLAVTGTCDSTVTDPFDTIVTFPVDVPLPVADTDNPGDNTIPPANATSATFPDFAVNDDPSAVGALDPIVAVAPRPTVIAPEAVSVTFPVVARTGEVPTTVIDPFEADTLTPV